MANPFGHKPGDLTSEHFCREWCLGCGVRRAKDFRCPNCDPWWTSPRLQAAIPVALGLFFVVTTASALLKSSKPIPGAAGSAAGPHLVTVIVEKEPPAPRPVAVSAASRGATVSAADISSPRITAPVPVQSLPVQREGAYINAVLRGQDDARRAQRIAARNQAMAAALQQQIQAVETPSPQPTPSRPPPTAASDLETAATEETPAAPS